jgi:hypothetical protein
MGKDRKEAENQVVHRRRNGQKRRSVAATVVSVGGGGVVGVGTTLAIQHFATETDNRYISGAAAGLGVLTAGVGLATRNRTVTEAGVGLALGAGAVFGSDLLSGSGVADGGAQLEPKRQAELPPARTTQAIREELQQVNKEHEIGPGDPGSELPPRLRVMQR